MNLRKKLLCHSENKRHLAEDQGQVGPLKHHPQGDQGDWE